MRYSLNWKVGFCNSADSCPEEFFAATVPGAVQLDYAKQYGLPDYRRGKNFEQYKWMEDKFWVYTAEFDATDIDSQKHLFLVTKGIDYKYDILINGKNVCSYEGMYRKNELDVTDFIGTVFTVKIVIYPVPKSDLPEVHKDTRDEANQCCKPAVSYGWDFHPRLIPLGIWDEIYIQATDCSKLIKPIAEYKLSDDLKSAEVKLSAEGFPDAEWQLCDPDGNIIFTATGEKQSFTVENVKLWWCNGYGEPNLYTWSVSVKGSEPVSDKIGFKTVSLVKARGSWAELKGYPMTRNTPPITLCLNGVSIFIKGSNWVAPEIFYGTIGYDRYREHLELVKKANLNFVRCWGGAIVNKESFFEICDELGIMVWQEFPLACNNYQGTEHYMSVLESEAEVIIDRLKGHACLMLWCGGNELFNHWSAMTDQSAALRLLNSMTYMKTPDIPFLPTAPVMGMGHGAYEFNYPDGREVMQVIAESRFTAYTEFGVPGCSTKETLQQIAEIEDLLPLEDNEIATAHGVHLQGLLVDRYFGKPDSIEEIINYRQIFQSAGLQFIFEEARRQKPYCSMVSNWCFNEPWPNTGGHCVVCYPNNIKPAYYNIAAACRSVLASARIRKLSYVANEMLDFDLFLLNDSLNKLPDGTVNVYVQVGDENKEHLLKWDYSNVAINTNVEGPTVRYRLPKIENADYIKIILECGEYSSKYSLLYRLPQKPLNAPKKMNTLLED